MTFEQFLKTHKISVSFNKDPESTIQAFQDIFNELLLKNTYLLDDYFERIITEDEVSLKEIAPLMSSLKTLFDIWQSITGSEAVIDVNRAFDVLAKEGFNINLEQEKINKIHSVINNELEN